MADLVKLSKSLDLKLPGEADLSRLEHRAPSSCTIYTSDYNGPVWVPDVEQDMSVRSGTPIAHARVWPDVRLVSPIAGIVGEVRCDDCGVLESVRIVSASDPDISACQELTAKRVINDREELIQCLSRSGFWALMRQRPYDIVPDPNVVPRDIFITAFDSAPLAGPMLKPDMSVALEAGIEALAVLTSGRVYLGVPYDSDISSRIAIVTEYMGAHPSGNPGVQAGLLLPLRKGEVIWTLDARTVVRIGRLLTGECYDFDAEVTVAGEAALTPCVVTTRIGAALNDIIAFHVKDNNSQVISGNPLTGYVEDVAHAALHYPFRQVSILNKKAKPRGSIWSCIKACFDFGFDDVFPLDIQCEPLLQAIESHDVARMELFGIHEVAPDDFAVLEYTDPRHRPIQSIVRRGLKIMHTEVV